MNKRNILLILVIGLSCFACGTKTPSSLRQAANQLDTTNIPSNPISEDASFKKKKEISLADALQLALQGNPELKSISQNLKIGEARVLQAKIKPNPEVSLAIEDLFGVNGREDYSQATLQLSQIIELGGKRTARIRTAKIFQEQLSKDYEIKRIEVLSSLTEKFIRTVADDHLLKLAKKAESLADLGLQNIQRRLMAGSASELEEAKAKVLLARYQILTEHAEHQLETSQRALAAYWGYDGIDFNRTKADLFQSVSLPSFETLAERVEKSPEIKKWIIEQRLKEAEEKLAVAKASSNLTLFGGPRYFDSTGEQTWVFGASLPIAIFDRNQGGRKEAEVLNQKVNIDIKVEYLRIMNALFALWQEARHAQTELEIMSTQILPQAERALESAQNGYEQGRFSYLDLIDAQRTLLEVHQENIEAAYALHSFVNSIEKLLGAPLND